MNGDGYGLTMCGWKGCQNNPIAKIKRQGRTENLKSHHNQIET